MFKNRKDIQGLAEIMTRMQRDAYADYQKMQGLEETSERLKQLCLLLSDECKSLRGKIESLEKVVSSNHQFTQNIAKVKDYKIIDANGSLWSMSDQCREQIHEQCRRDLSVSGYIYSHKDENKKEYWIKRETPEVKVKSKKKSKKSKKGKK